MGYGLDVRGSISGKRKEPLSTQERSYRLWDSHRLLLKGYGGGLFPGGKGPRRETDHSPSTSAEVKNTWIYTSTPPYVFMA
jgi:hypothetical protein